MLLGKWLSHVKKRLQNTDITKWDSIWKKLSNYLQKNEVKHTYGLYTEWTKHLLLRAPYFLKKSFELVSELAEVARSDEAKARFLQAVACQFNDLVMGEAEHSIRQWQHVLWGAAVDDLLDALLHLCCGLKNTPESSADTLQNLRFWIQTLACCLP